MKWEMDEWEIVAVYEDYNYFAEKRYKTENIHRVPHHRSGPAERGLRDWVVDNRW